MEDIGGEGGKREMTTCAPLVNHEGEVIGHITFSDNILLKTGTAQPMWCGYCRMHLLHFEELRGERQPSYYDPFWVWRCRRCGRAR